MEKHEPNWSPLEALIPDDQWGQWMWMGRVHHDDQTIEQYKHVTTRGYINVSTDGRMWQVQYRASEEISTPPSVQEATVEEAFEVARVWPWSLNDPEHPRPSWMPGAYRPADV